MGYCPFPTLGRDTAGGVAIGRAAHTTAPSLVRHGSRCTIGFQAFSIGTKKSLSRQTCLGSVSRQRFLVVTKFVGQLGFMCRDINLNVAIEVSPLGLVLGRDMIFISRQRRLNGRSRSLSRQNFLCHGKVARLVSRHGLVVSLQGWGWDWDWGSAHDNIPSERLERQCVQ